LFTQEIRWKGIAFWTLVGILIGLIAIFLIPPLFTTDRDSSKLTQLIPGSITAVVIGVLWIFRTLRISIDEHTLTVGFSPFKEHVSLNRVVACGTTTYNWIAWGGFGIRFRRQAKLYNVPGDEGRAVRVRINDGKQLLFSSPDPAAVCRALRERNSNIVEL
jgi:hypothetical protein